MFLPPEKTSTSARVSVRLSPGTSMRTKRAGLPVATVPEAGLASAPFVPHVGSEASGLAGAGAGEGFASAFFASPFLPSFFFAGGLGFFVLLFAGIGLSKPAYISGLMPRA